MLCPRDSQWDCGTDSTLGQLPKCGSPWDVPGTLSPLTGTWDNPTGDEDSDGKLGHECVI